MWLESFLTGKQIKSQPAAEPVALQCWWHLLSKQYIQTTNTHKQTHTHTQHSKSLQSTWLAAGVVDSGELFLLAIWEQPGPGNLHHLFPLFNLIVTGEPGLALGQRAQLVDVLRRLHKTTKSSHHCREKERAHISSYFITVLTVMMVKGDDQTANWALNEMPEERWVHVNGKAKSHKAAAVSAAHLLSCRQSQDTKHKQPSQITSGGSCLATKSTDSEVTVEQ